MTDEEWSEILPFVEAEFNAEVALRCFEKTLSLAEIANFESGKANYVQKKRLEIELALARRTLQGCY